MKKNILYFFILVSSFSYSQNPDQQVLLIKERDEYVNKIVDSLNSIVITDCKSLPTFFTNENFDREVGSKYWLGMHAFVSIRKIIIDRLTNYELMWCVMKSKNKNIHKKYTGKSKRFYYSSGKIPFEQFSTYELVDLRLDELENIQSLGKQSNK